ncbi:tRNA lysidine(34) synthetase TilS [Microlunatus ginsengisoli]|uniref:tRNA(Ile)-lysidine synthase n=1 Tax=Microlunatus ginsengisoli TaxID=363863 RepID=A0ABP6ZGX4_9ACTN
MARRDLGPARLRLVNALRRCLVAGDRALLVACSGGADSLALADAAVVVGRRRELPVSAVVVDHGLQPGSAAVADRAADLLGGLGVADIGVVRVDVVDAGSGPEAAARSARRTALLAAADAVGATVLLGHTRDDQAETVLLGLARGSGTRSLSGMAVRSGRFLRPFLGIPRSVTVAACAEGGVEPWQDPHNIDPTYVRSRVRHRVLPVLEAELGPGMAEALARTAAQARADADLLDALAREAAGRLVPGDGLDCAGLERLPGPLRRRVLLGWLAECGARDLGQAHIEAVEALVVDWHGQGAVDVPGLAVVRRDGRLRVP